MGRSTEAHMERTAPLLAPGSWEERRTSSKEHPGPCCRWLATPRTAPGPYGTIPVCAEGGAQIGRVTARKVVVSGRKHAQKCLLGSASNPPKGPPRFFWDPPWTATTAKPGAKFPKRQKSPKNRQPSGFAATSARGPDFSQKLALAGFNGDQAPQIFCPAAD